MHHTWSSIECMCSEVHDWNVTWEWKLKCLPCSCVSASNFCTKLYLFALATIRVFSHKLWRGQVRGGSRKFRKSGQNQLEIRIKEHFIKRFSKQNRSVSSRRKGGPSPKSAYASCPLGHFILRDNLSCSVGLAQWPGLVQTLQKQSYHVQPKN